MNRTVDQSREALQENLNHMPQTHNESGAGADMFDLSNFDFEELIQWETTVCISTAMAPGERANVDQQQA